MGVERQPDGSLLVVFHEDIQRFVALPPGQTTGVLFRYLGKWYVAA
jgi:hypothetical protein